MDREHTNTCTNQIPAWLIQLKKSSFLYRNPLWCNDKSFYLKYFFQNENFDLQTLLKIAKHSKIQNERIRVVIKCEIL